jgi:hypothetical protein
LEEADMRISTLLLCTALAGVPAALAQSPGDAGDPVEKIQQHATFCEGTYALCIKAPCSAIPTLDRLGTYAASHALCSCEVVKGWSMGPGACADRQPIEQHGRTYLISTYSNRFNSEEKTLSCADAKTLWAWCYGAPCVIDSKDPGKAVCTCPVQQSAAMTLGGGCRQDACSGIWSAAVPQGDAFANEHFYRYMQKNHPDVPVNPPAAACPASSGGS